MLPFKKKFSTILNLSIAEVEHQAWLTLAKKELSQVEADIFDILSKHGIQDSQELDKWFKTGKIEEATAWKEFFLLDGLEYKRKLLNDLLVDLQVK